MTQTVAYRRTRTLIGTGVVAEAVAIPTRTNSVMHGVVTRESDEIVPSRVLIICGKEGPGDLWRRCAEFLARDGFAVIRFDPAGLGETAGCGGPVDVPIDAFFRKIQEGAHTEGNIDAVLWARGTFNQADIFLMGPCGACSSLLLAAAARPRDLAGLILVTPAVLYSGAVDILRRYDAAVARSSYLRRLLDPTGYVNFVRGRSDYRLIGALIFQVLREQVRAARRLLARLDRSPRPRHAGFNRHFWDGFRAVMGHRIPILFLLAELDNETADFNAEFKTVVLDRRREYADVCTVKTLPKTDHSFLFESGRRLAFAAIGEWLHLTHKTAQPSHTGLKGKADDAVQYRSS